MNIKKIMPLFAIAMGLMLAFTTSGFKAAVNAPQNTAHYFLFDTNANDNDADLIENWTPITQQEYEASGCFDLHRACMIKTASVPSSVPCTQQSSYKDPYADGTVVLEVKNRASN